MNKIEGILKKNSIIDDIDDHYRLKVFPHWQSRIEEMKKQMR